MKKSGTAKGLANKLEGSLLFHNFRHSSSSTFHKTVITPKLNESSKELLKLTYSVIGKVDRNDFAKIIVSVFDNLYVIMWTTKTAFPLQPLQHPSASTVDHKREQKHSHWRKTCFING